MVLNRHRGYVPANDARHAYELDIADGKLDGKHFGSKIVVVPPPHVIPVPVVPALSPVPVVPVAPVVPLTPPQSDVPLPPLSNDIERLQHQLQESQERAQRQQATIERLEHALTPAPSTSTAPPQNKDVEKLQHQLQDSQERAQRQQAMIERLEGELHRQQQEREWQEEELRGTREYLANMPRTIPVVPAVPVMPARTMITTPNIESAVALDAADGVLDGQYFGNPVVSPAMTYTVPLVQRTAMVAPSVSSAMALDAADGVLDGTYYGKQIMTAPGVVAYPPPMF